VCGGAGIIVAAINSAATAIGNFDTSIFVPANDKRNARKSARGELRRDEADTRDRRRGSKDYLENIML
jgi:hypothetical protein